MTENIATPTRTEFQEEKWRDFREELQPLAEKHYEEAGLSRDIPLDIDHEKYLAMNDADTVVVYTARKEGALVGYAIFFVVPSTHSKNSLQAVQDAIYIKPEHRGFGHKFIAWCDDQLTLRGVQVVFHHVHVACNFGPMLERQGYKLVDHVYGRRLD